MTSNNLHMNPFQLASIVLAASVFTGCDNRAADKSAHDPALQSAIADVVSRSQTNMVFVEGGEFMMGDFGKLDKARTGGLSYTNGDHGTKPLHPVKLSSYSISAYQITFHDYLIYRQAKGLASNPYPVEHITAQFIKDGYNNRYNNKLWLILSSDSETSPNQSQTPAYLPWEAASEYCEWLGEQTGLSYSLPTEAQWEYAARNRGQYVTFATDNGKYELGHNLPTYAQRQAKGKLAKGEPGGEAFPVGSFPVSPLGLYDMDANGYEWVKDWFDEAYYSYSPVEDPQGPAEPVLIEREAREPIVAKVIRSDSKPSDWSITASRWYHQLWQQYTPEIFDGFYFVTARCVVNSPEPVTKRKTHVEP